MELSDILSDKQPEPEAPAVTNPDPVEKQIAERYESKRTQHRDKEMEARGLVRDPATGQFLKKDEQAKAEPSPDAKAEPLAEKTEVKQEVKAEKKEEEFSPKERAFMKAMEEERKKRQELERKLHEIAAQQQKPAAQPDPNAPKTFWDDPEGALQRHQQQTQALLVNTKLNMSEAIARRNHADFQEKAEIFGEMVKANPVIYQQMLNQLDPAEFAYQTAKQHKEMSEIGNIDEYRKKIEAETRARVEKEMREKMDAEARARAAEAARLPGSLTNVPGTAPASRPVWGGPTPLDSILKT